MKNKVTKLNNELKNSWSFLSLVTNIAASVVLISVALGNVGVPKMILAGVGAILLVNTACELYGLVRK